MWPFYLKEKRTLNADLRNKKLNCAFRRGKKDIWRKESYDAKSIGHEGTNNQLKRTRNKTI